MKKTFLLLTTATILFTACKKSINENAAYSAAEQEQLMSTWQINSVIRDEVNRTGSFDWKIAKDEVVWSALQHSDKIVSIGYKPADETDVDNRLHAINTNEAKWKAAKQQLLEMIFNEEKKKKPKLKMEDLELWKVNKLPVINVEIQSLQTIKLLRKSNLVRYAEPMGYEPLTYEQDASSVDNASIFGGSGCGGYTGNSSLIAGVDYTVVTPNAKVSWNYSYHGIQNAWTKSTGAGTKVMVIDTGVSPDQDNLGSEFNQGLSSGRTIEKIFTIPNATDANDGCGHGTTMCGTVAAPRCTDGNSCGVAYNSDFVICRASKDVYIDESSEVRGVSDAYIWAADNATVKIISLSIGRITNNGQIKDAINYAYGKGKLMFCAGGTSFSWSAGFVGVVFPASLKNVQAITGVRDEANLNACKDCHKGRQIDFVIVMEKSSNDLHCLSTATSGDVPTTVGGSSVATATAAGIAALVWSRFPTFTREEVVNKLTVTASNYPNSTRDYGWGKLNADAATN